MKSLMSFQQYGSETESIVILIIFGLIFLAAFISKMAGWLDNVDTVDENDSDWNLDSNVRRRHISQKVKDQVWRRDLGKCTQCGSNENLEFDHIIPFSKGGANTYRNIQLLCESCNRYKSDNIG